MTKQRPLPLRQGNQIQFYTYALLAANLNQAAEGTVGSPISESSTKIVATIGQYADLSMEPAAKNKSAISVNPYIQMTRSMVECK